MADQKYPLINILSKGLEFSTKQSLNARVENLMRQIRYEEKEQTNEFRKAKKNGWDLKKLEMLCCLNSFYQLVLGPLSSVSKSKSSSNFIKDHPIAYGNIRLTIQESEKLALCHTAFMEIITKLDIDFWWLSVNHGHDLLYKLANSQKKHE